MEKSAFQVESPTQHRLIQETLGFMRRRALVEGGERVLVAVSGGLDSSVLLHSLSRVARVLGIQIEVAHVDHGTRGEASEREALWVKVLAERLHLKLHPLRLVKPERTNQEELRNLRRKALQELAKDIGCVRVATAHHANDNAETFLMRAMSGTGSYGLAGIRPRDGVWIKPLLWATRADLEDYARAHRLAWVEDPSNERSAYLRNHLRNVLIPQLEEIRTGSLKNLARAAERMEEEETSWDLWLETQLDDGPKETLSVAWLERWPVPMQRRVLRFWLKRIGIVSAPALVEALLRGDELVHPLRQFLTSFRHDHLQRRNGIRPAVGRTSLHRILETHFSRIVARLELPPFFECASTSRQPQCHGRLHATGPTHGRRDPTSLLGAHSMAPSRASP